MSHDGTQMRIVDIEPLVRSDPKVLIRIFTEGGNTCVGQLRQHIEPLLVDMIITGSEIVRADPQHSAWTVIERIDLVRGQPVPGVIISPEMRDNGMSPIYMDQSVCFRPGPYVSGRVNGKRRKAIAHFSTMNQNGFETIVPPIIEMQNVVDSQIKPLLRLCNSTKRQCGNIIFRC